MIKSASSIFKLEIAMREREKKIHERIKIPHTTLTKRRVLPRAYGGTINEKNYYWRKRLRTKKNTTIAWEKKVHQSEKKQGIGIVMQNAGCGNAGCRVRSQGMGYEERNETTLKATQGMMEEWEPNRG